MVGKREEMLRYIWDLMREIKMSPPEHFRVMLGVHYTRLSLRGHRMLLIRQEEYGEMLLKAFRADYGNTVKECRTPVCAPEPIEYETGPGALAAVSRKHLGGLAYLSRCSTAAPGRTSLSR